MPGTSQAAANRAKKLINQRITSLVISVPPDIILVT
jgi:hypothetical protein